MPVPAHKLALGIIPSFVYFATTDSALQGSVQDDSSRKPPCYSSVYAWSRQVLPPLPCTNPLCSVISFWEDSSLFSLFKERLDAFYSDTVLR